VSMRITFLGTPAFAVPALKRLIDDDRFEISAVFTQPDRPAGRGQRLHPGPVKLLATEKGIPVFQPARIRVEENRPVFEGLRPDVIVVAAYGQILPGWLLQSARLGCVNIHASLLPRYRGAAPISWAIVNGETSTGVTTMLMAEKLDAGPILLQREVAISSVMTAGELSESLAAVGADLLIETLAALEKGTLNPVEQDESKVTWAPRISKEAARISWEKSARQVHDLIRGMNPWPIAYSMFREEKIQIFRSLPEGRADEPAVPGTLLGLTKTGIRVQCGGGTVIELLELQRPAKARVTGREFASGSRLRPGEIILR